MSPSTGTVDLGAAERFLRLAAATAEWRAWATLQALLVPRAAGRL